MTDTAAPSTGPAAVPDNAIFISYSRLDEDFARRLADGLEARGLTTWFDRDDIPPATEWMTEIKEGLAAALALVVVISPNWASSDVCGVEVDAAVQLGKRVVPVLHREAADLDAELRKRNWIFWRDDGEADAALDAIVEALEVDPEWTRLHTRLLQDALGWEQSGHDKHLLLNRTELREAEAAFGVSRPDSAPQVTELQRRFVAASRERATRRLQRAVVGAVVIAALSVTLAVVAVLARQEADRQRAAAEERERLAQSRALAAESLAIASAEEEAALLLAVDAVGMTDEPTSEALDALLRAIQYVDADEWLRTDEADELLETVDRLNRELGVVSLDDSGTALRIDATGLVVEVIGDGAEPLDGDRDLTISHDGQVAMWDVRTADGIVGFGRLDLADGTRLPDIEPEGRSYAAAFTGTGDVVTLSSPSADPAVDLLLTVWDPQTATPRFSAPIAFRFSDEQAVDLENVLLTFSPTRSLGAVVNLFGQPQLLSPDDLTFVGGLLDVDCSETADDEGEGDEGDVTSLADEFMVTECRVAFGLDADDELLELADSGSEILAGFDDDVLTTIDFVNRERSWSFAVDDWVALACEYADRNLTESEWLRFRGPDTPYRATCPGLPAGGA